MASAAWSSAQELPGSTIVSTGRAITPAGRHIDVGSYPVKGVLSPDGRFAVFTDIGFRQQLSVVRLSDGQLVQKLEFNARTQGRPMEGLYYGLAFRPGTRMLYASRGAEDKISIFRLGIRGELAPMGEIALPAAPGSYVPHNPAGIAFNADGSLMAVAYNQTAHDTGYKGRTALVDPDSGSVLRVVQHGGYPLDAAFAGGRFLVGSERDGIVHAISPDGQVSDIRTGSAPVGLAVSQDGRTALSVNSASDTLSVIRDGAVQATILLRPAGLDGLPGTEPLEAAFSPDEKTAYVSCSGLNAVAVVDLGARELKGYIPTGWLPTGVVVSPDGRTLAVASAKGVRAKNPNGQPVGSLGTYGPNIMEGTVSLIDVPSAAELRRHTAQVLANNFVRDAQAGPTHPDFTDPGIEHVIYIVKENRTYDNVLGDLPQGNGDPSLCLFPRRITPNQHALAERFVLLDNFHVNAEVSQDGWVYSTTGMISAFASRNTVYDYSGRQRNYDTEGSNNNVPVDLIGMPDVSTPASGYIWDHMAKHGVSYRSYGFFSSFGESPDMTSPGMEQLVPNGPQKKALLGNADLNFLKYDLEYADSEAYEKHGWSWPRQKKTFGAHDAPSRFSAWKREFDQFVKEGRMPQFMMVRLGQDHTSGTRAGQPTPESMVADNDYAVGQVVEAVSKSPFWKKTAICILEDDAQAGLDHVDSHRSIAFVISPAIPRGLHDDRFYNTTSMIRTMGLLLGLPAMSQWDACAAPISVFGSKFDNDEPYEAILPEREILCQVNGQGAFGQAESELISNHFEESVKDEDLNLILWRAIKGPDAPLPPLRRSWIDRALARDND
jgi:DNA-binding beta-propeller fold protein YncE